MIAYDTNVLIYALENKEEWARPAKEVVEQGENQGAVLSVLAWQELMAGLVLHRIDLVDELSAAIADLRATQFVPVSLAICERAVLLTKKYGKKLYGYDAVHLATAIEHGAEVFITNDKTLTALNVSEIVIRGLDENTET